MGWAGRRLGGARKISAACASHGGARGGRVCLRGRGSGGSGGTGHQSRIIPLEVAGAMLNLDFAALPPADVFPPFRSFARLPTFWASKRRALIHGKRESNVGMAWWSGAAEVLAKAAATCTFAAFRCNWEKNTDELGYRDFSVVEATLGSRMDMGRTGQKQEETAKPGRKIRFVFKNMIPHTFCFSSRCKRRRYMRL